MKKKERMNRTKKIRRIATTGETIRKAQEKKITRLKGRTKEGKLKKIVMPKERRIRQRKKRQEKKKSKICNVTQKLSIGHGGCSFSESRTSSE